MNTFLALFDIGVPYAAIALALLPVVFLASGGILASASQGERPRFRTRFLVMLPRAFFAIAYLAIVLGLMDIGYRKTVTVSEPIPMRFIIATDNSSSMYNFKMTEEPIYCSDHGIAEEFPRIDGACQAIDEIVTMVKDHAARVPHRIGLVRFARESVIQVLPTADYASVRDAIQEINWRAKKQIGIHTEIHLAMVDQLLIALDRNRRAKAGYVPISESDIGMLLASFAPPGLRGGYVPPRVFESRLAMLRAELRDTVFLLITDAMPYQVNLVLDKDPYSLYSVMEFFRQLEIPVYVISTESDHQILAELAEKTGYGSSTDWTRGKFQIVNKAVGYEHMRTLVRGVVERHLDREVLRTRVVRKSFTPVFAGIAFLALVLGVAMRESISRTLSGH